MSEELIIGRFGSTFGISGWIKVISFTSVPQDILNYNPWLIKKDHIWQPIAITKKEIRGKHILVKLANFDSPEAVKVFTNQEIAVDKNQLLTLPPGEYYWADLIGLRVLTKDGVELGIVESLMETGSNDVLVVKGERRRLIPYLSFVVLKVDLGIGQIIVDWNKDF
jgi:16S rRNA processing protein RimM